MWSSEDGVSGATTVEPTPYEVPKLEAHFYYAGVGPKGHGPKLVYRTSDDKYKDKLKHLIGNVLSFGAGASRLLLCAADLKCNISLAGPELPHSKLKPLMYERIGVPSEFKYPDDGLLTLKGMLTVNQLNNPNTSNLQGDHIRRVLKRGFRTGTTVGTLTRFMSFVRQYFPTSNVESLEVAILSHDKDEWGAFSNKGDSGSLVVSPVGEFVALLTGGTNSGKVAPISPSLLPSSGSGVSSRRSSPVRIWTWMTLKDPSPTWHRFISFFPSFLSESYP